jgi:hypothetical protein
MVPAEELLSELEAIHEKESRKSRTEKKKN